MYLFYSFFQSIHGLPVLYKVIFEFIGSLEYATFGDFLHILDLLRFIHFDNDVIQFVFLMH